MKTTILAALAACALATPALADGPPIDRMWHNEPGWAVAQSRFPDGKRACFLIHNQGPATVGFWEADNGRTAALTYEEDGLPFTISGQVRMQVDNRRPWVAYATAKPSGMLSINLSGDKDPAVRFFAELRDGYALRIATAAGVRTISLIGSARAIAAAAACIDTIMAQAQAPTWQTPPTALNPPTAETVTPRRPRDPDVSF